MAAGKGGGSWKVAYADFVTAMMAFFLVMWIGAQDSKTRQSVANYFIDPMGVSKMPSRTGAVLDAPTHGNVAAAQSAALDKGRDPPSKGNNEFGPATKLMMDWIKSNPRHLARWKEKATACREAAARSPEVRNRNAGVEAVAERELSKLMRAEFIAGNPAKGSDVYQDLVIWSLREVNFEQVATDLLKQ